MSRSPSRRPTSQPASQIKAPAEPPPRSIGLALGGGGARGLAHIVMLEVFDEMGIRPAAITGTSIGAMFGAAYAAGLSAKAIRAHTEETLSQRFDLVRQLFTARADPVQKLFRLLPLRRALLNPELLLDLILPSRLPRDFSALQIPLALVATDFYAQEAVALTTGPLRRAIAASLALPAIFQPVVIENRTLMDGGLVNPLPFDLLAGRTDITVAIDVSGSSRDHDASGVPSVFDAVFASSQILQRSIVREKLKAARPDIYIDATVDRFQLLEFHRFREILDACKPSKEQLKRQLDRVLSSQTVAETLPLTPVPPPSKPRRSLIRRAKGQP